MLFGRLYALGQDGLKGNYKYVHNLTQRSLDRKKKSNQVLVRLKPVNPGRVASSRRSGGSAGWSSVLARGGNSWRRWRETTLGGGAWWWSSVGDSVATRAGVGRLRGRRRVESVGGGAGRWGGAALNSGQRISELGAGAVLDSIVATGGGKGR